MEDVERENFALYSRDSIIYMKYMFEKNKEVNKVVLVIQIIIKWEAGRSCKGNLWISAKIHFLSQCSWNTNVAQRSGKIACLTGMKSHGIHRIRSKLSTLRLSLMSIDTLQNTRPGQPLDIDSFLYTYVYLLWLLYAANGRKLYTTSYLNIYY